jgi:hypothetical protein
MHPHVTTRGVPLILFVLLVVSVFTAPAAATVSISGNTTYGGVSDGGDEAIEVQTSISPDGEEIVDVRLSFSGTGQTFLEDGSFDRTISPGDANIDITAVGDGEFEINQVGANEEITFNFEVYPKTINQESINTAQVVIEYTQSGQQLRDTQTFETDLTNSAAFELDEQQQWTGAIGIVNLLSYLINIVLIGVLAVLVYNIRQEDPEPYS